MEILNFLSSLSTATYIRLFSVVVASLFVSFILWAIFQAVKGEDLRYLVVSETTDKLSQTKFWTNIAYILGSICFVKYNFDAGDKSSLVEIWALYLSVIGGSNVFAIWMKHKSFAANRKWDSYDRRTGYDDYMTDEEESNPYRNQQRQYKYPTYKPDADRVDEEIIRP